MRRLALVAVVLVSLLAMPVGGAATAGSDRADAVDAPPLQADGNTTATPTANNSSSGPTIASQVRLTSITFEDEFLSVSVREADGLRNDGPVRGVHGIASRRRDRGDDPQGEDIDD